MWLLFRLYLLMALLFGIVYGIIVAIAFAIGVQNVLAYGAIAVIMVLVQYLLGPKMVEMTMGVRYASKAEYPELHKMVEELAYAAKIYKPRVGIANIPVPNAFAFGRWGGDGRICVSESLMKLLSPKELRAVLGHEISHLRHRDVAVITMLSLVPMILYYVAWNFMWMPRDRERGNQAAIIGLLAFLLYFITNLLVLYGSRIREYYADLGSVKLGNAPSDMATALYKLVYGSARVPKEVLHQCEGYKAFFANDPSRARNEIKELRELDIDMSGTIDPQELESIRTAHVKIGFADRLLEVFSTHPNMVKRMAHLAKLTSLYRESKVR
ncbi:MAG TPA: zinc metalloprotease HtpX [Candidatus Hypogeohydataceae bacterium YC41]